MVQREIADRLRAAPGQPHLRLAQRRSSRSPPRCGCCGRSIPRCSRRGRGSSPPSCGCERRGPGADAATRALVRDAFAHRRKSLARSLELATPGRMDAVRAALAETGLRADARAESLSPEDFVRLAAKLAEG